jgi:DNA-binding response OmpR family regulator
MRLQPIRQGEDGKRHLQKKRNSSYFYPLHFCLYLFTFILNQGGRFIMNEHCVLVIEDQDDLAELYKATLNKAGYKVQLALTGEEGLAEFEANGADVVLLDMTLPEMQGTQVLRELRTLNATVPIIIITGETGNLYRDESARLGVQGYLSKPPDYDQLLGMIRRALESPTEEAEVVTLRLPKRIIERLTEIDSNLERAITMLAESRKQRAKKAV